MSKKNSKLLLEDILDAIGDIEQFTASISFEYFITDKKTQNAVIRSLEVVGEASNKLSKDFLEAYPGIEWNRIIRTRHILIHEYDSVNLDVVWKIIQVHLPELKTALTKILFEQG